MRSVKNGGISIPKISWLVKASAHREFIQDLIGAGLDGGLIEKHAHLMHQCERIAAYSAKGRPEKEPPKNALLALRDPDVAVYREIEAMRKNGSILGAIKTYLRSTWDKNSNVNQDKYVTKNTGQLRNRYNRGRKKVVQKIRI